MKTRIAPMVHRDEVHGDVRFDRVAVALLDTDAMQRLGRVNQLGFAPLVYRGGNHSRLSHVMGAYHASGKLVDALRRNYSGEGRWPDGAVEPRLFLPVAGAASEEDRWAILRHLVGWAALLHDLGHVPLGHTLEDEFDQIYLKHDDFQSPRAEFLWVGLEGNGISEIRRVFERNDLLPKVFGDNGISGQQVWRAVMLTCFYREKRLQSQFQSFQKILDAAAESVSRNVDAATARGPRRAKGRIIIELQRALSDVGDRLFFPYLADIVADTICADYLDYLQRDPRNLGLDVLKDDRVISQFWVGRHKHSGLHMALALEDKRGKPRLDTTTGVVDLVRQRYRFAEIVYYHKTKAAASVMFATALRLLDTIEECPLGPRFVLEPGSAGKTLEGLLRGEVLVAELEKRAMPSALLDPEIGDESLMLLMQQRAITQVAEAVPKKRGRVLRPERHDSALRGLRALALLQNLSRRRLHKAVFALDADTWMELFRGSGTLAAEDLDEAISRLRTDHRRRSALEHDMLAALTDGGIQSPGEDALLLYIPERKSQAKGIETGALDAGDVITLGEHRAVKAQVAELGAKYRALWRLLVFAQPGLNDPLALSRAVDVLLKELVPKLDLAAYEGRDALAKACWFKYVGVDLTRAGIAYRRIPGRSEKSFHLGLARSSSAFGLSDEEVAVRAALLDVMKDRQVKPSDGRLRLKVRFKRDGAALSALVARSDVDDPFRADTTKEIAAVQEGLERLAIEMTRGSGLTLVPTSATRRRRRRATA